MGTRRLGHLRPLMHSTQNVTQSQWEYPREPDIFSQSCGNPWACLPLGKIGACLLARAHSKCSPLKGSSSLWGPSNFRDACYGVTYRIRRTWKWSNTILHAAGNFGVISSFCSDFCKQDLLEMGGITLAVFKRVMQVGFCDVAGGRARRSSGITHTEWPSYGIGISFSGILFLPLLAENTEKFITFLQYFDDKP